MSWSIGAYVFPLIDPITGSVIGSHLYLEVWNDGQRVEQVNGLATNRTTGQPEPIGDNADQLKSFISTNTSDPNQFFIENSGNATQSNYPYDGAIIFTGTDTASLTAALNQISAVTEYINNQNFSYDLPAITGFNSNSVFSGIVSAIAQVSSLNQVALQSLISSAVNPAGIDNNIFQGNTWSLNPDDTSTAHVGAVVHMTTSSFKHTLFGTSGDDKLYGGNGNDTLAGREGSDLLDGGGGKLNTADYSNNAEMPSGTAVTLGLSPPFTGITAILGNFSDEGVDFKIIDRYGDVDSLVRIQKVIGQAGANNVIDLQLHGLFQEISPGKFHFNGKDFEFQNFSSIDATSHENIFVLADATGLTINSDGDDDVFYGSGVVYDQATARIFSGTTGAFDILNGFAPELVHGLTIIRPDTSQSETLPPGYYNYNYSGEANGGTFTISTYSNTDILIYPKVIGSIITNSRYDFQETQTFTATINGVTHINTQFIDSGPFDYFDGQQFNLSSFFSVYTGTNNGDTINIVSTHSINHGTIGNGGESPVTFISGAGNDTINVTPNIFSTLVYTGGNDTVHSVSGGSLGTIRFASGISLADISGSAVFGPGGHMTVNIAGHGSIFFDRPSPTEFVLDDGGSFYFGSSGNIIKVGTSIVASNIFGTWGDDILTGAANATQKIFGLSGTNILAAGINAHDTMYGGSDTNTFISESGVNTIYGGQGQNTYNIGIGAITTIANTLGINHINFTNSNLSDYTLVADGSSLKFVDSLSRAVLTIADVNDFGDITFANGQHAVASTLFFTAGEPQASDVPLDGDSYVISASVANTISDSEGLNNILVTNLAHTQFTFSRAGDTMELFANGNSFATVEGIHTFSTITFSDGFTALVSSLIAGSPQYIDASGGLFDARNVNEPISVHLTNVTQTYFGEDFGNLVWNESNFASIGGGAGNDVLRAGPFFNTLFGYAGNNTLIGSSETFGGSTADYTASPTGIIADLGTGIVSENGYGGSDTLVNIHSIVGSYHDDIITGSAADDNIQEGGGNNIIDGGAGNNSLGYGPSPSGVTVNLLTGTANNGTGIDTINNIQNVTGNINGGNDLTGDNNVNILTVFFGNNTVSGMGGDDQIYIQGDGDNIISGGAGNDIIRINASGGTNTILFTPGDGDDTLIDVGASSTFNFVGVSGLAYTRIGNDLIINYDESVRISNYYSAPTTSYQVSFDGGQAVALSDLVAGATFNQAPVAQADNFDAFLNTILTGNVLADNGHGADSDPDGNILSVSTTQTVQSVFGGTVVFSSSGDFTYAPTAGFVGSDSFTYTLQDGHGGFATGIVSLTIKPPPPITQDDEFIILPNQTLSGNVLADNGHGEDSTATAGTLLFVSPVSDQSQAGGTYTLNDDGSFVYNPAVGFSGIDGFDYLLIDSLGRADIGHVFITVTQDQNNQPPVAQPDDFNISFNQVLAGNVLLNNGHGADSDPDGNPLSVTAFTEATTAGGSITLNADGTFNYHPLLGYVGTDSFTYTLLDGQGGSDAGIVTISVAAPSGATLGSSGDDTINGGNGGQTILGLGGDDTLSGGNGMDTLYAGSGDDTLHGNNGNDILYAGSGNDLLFGDSGDDLLVAATGNVTMTGGRGDDTFQFTSVNGYGTVTDFNANRGDKIDLSQLIDAPHPLQGSIDNFVHATQQGNNTIISVDIDGSANGSNFVAVATLQGVHNFDVSQAEHNGTLII